MKLDLLILAIAPVVNNTFLHSYYEDSYYFVKDKWK